MMRLAAIVALAVAVAGCDLIDSATDALKNAQATAADLETTTGLRPSIGFNWKNGRLSQVTVTYPSLPETRSLPELVGAVRAAIRKEFKQDADSIVLGFTVAKASS